MKLIILGTSHIARESVKEVKRIMTEEKPDIIALELDRRRIYALLHRKRSKLSLYHINKIGIKGFGFALLGQWVSKRLGRLVGVSPGTEMLTAMKLAKKQKIPVIPIDQDIEITLKKFSKSLSWKEKWNFLKDLFYGIFRKQELLHRYRNLDLTKVPKEDFIREIIRQVKLKYPNIYKVLILERNSIMAARLRHIMNANPEKKIFAIVGAGHRDGILKLLKSSEGSITYSFSFGQ